MYYEKRYKHHITWNGQEAYEADEIYYCTIYDKLQFSFLSNGTIAPTSIQAISKCQKTLVNKNGHLDCEDV